MEVELVTMAERIALEISSMSPQAQQQVLDFALSLKRKEQQVLEADMDAVIEENLIALEELAK